MNSQGLGMFSMLSGGQGSSDAAPSIPAIFAGKNELQGFSDALQGQIALLQQQADLAQLLPDGAIPADDGNLQSLLGAFRQMQDGQDFAALMGDGLPSVKKMTQDIDLEKTLQALRDVLQYAASAAVQTSNPDAKRSVQLDAPDLEKLQEDLTKLDQQLAAVMAPIVTEGAEAAQKTVAAVLTNRVIPENTEKTLLQQGNLLQQTVKSLQERSVLPQQSAISSQPLPSDAVINDNQEVNAAVLTSGEQLEKDTPAFVEEPAEQGRRLATVLPDERMELSAAGKILDIARPDRQPANNIGTEVPEMTRQITHPRWQQDFAERIVWMQGKSMSAAEIRLNPQHMGPVSVRIDVNQDQQTAITFTASNAAVREAIDAAMPRLREMLNAQQLHLVQADVTQHSFSGQGQGQDFAQARQEQHAADNPGSGHDGTDGDKATGLNEEIEMSRVIAGQGLLNVRV